MQQQCWNLLEMFAYFVTFFLNLKMLIFTFAKLAKELSNSLTIYVNIVHVYLISPTQTLLCVALKLND